MTVRAPARLHLGFLDLDGAVGRRFGSLGIAIERPVTEVTVTRAAADAESGPDATRAARARDAARTALGIEQAFAVAVDAALPAHNGLGSGTQLALAVGVAVARLCGRNLSAREVATLLGRGRRSAIGMEAFEAGGVILDGGKALSGPATHAPPPLLARLPVPDAWRILLVYDRAREGLSGDAEMKAMATLPKFPPERAAHFCHLMLLRALPALAEGDALAFGTVIGEWQRALGDHYAAAQGGARFLSADVAAAVAMLEEAGVPGVGQSSWGPTGFAIVGDPAEAETLLGILRRRFASSTNLFFDCVRGNNRGAEIIAL
ncbi:GHMP kinase [Xanthobacter autotrophicus]|uniref:beta-ribofuranosylaminobenzene 5'-phosphate synthase family protein n=1 Tax=Xanthobacter TaxID=279 RepID=UPI0024AA6623|nr:beta-ribofuranosylaminobenzene 5'-phosphate synthase family protein [Xanthobacter autotrophicus]MDI4664187.1 GHMP kinase [Xanthobacter autotrophicus]